MTTNPKLLKTFDERAIWFLHYLYEEGGSEYKGIDVNSFNAYRIPEASSPDEFNRIIESLTAKGWVRCGSVRPAIGGPTYYNDMKLTEMGIKEARKAFPQLPLIGLVNQTITTGDLDRDGKINHAKHLFFSEPSTMDNMRSACQTLSFVLEPLRKDLKNYFADADVEHFFQLVNKFDIRHNNDFTKSLSHPEQLEWVFYSLLNTINTYTKLKKRL